MDVRTGNRIDIYKAVRRAVRRAVHRDDRTVIDRMGVRTANYRAFLVY